MVREHASRFTRAAREHVQSEQGSIYQQAKRDRFGTAWGLICAIPIIALFIAAFVVTNLLWDWQHGLALWQQAIYIGVVVRVLYVGCQKVNKFHNDHAPRRRYLDAG